MWPMRHLAMTGIETAASISLMSSGSDMRATPPSRRMRGRDALERHHRRGARLLGDPRLVGGHDVHDDAALQHLRQAHLQPELFLRSAHDASLTTRCGCAIAGTRSRAQSAGGHRIATT